MYIYGHDTISMLWGNTTSCVKWEIGKMFVSRGGGAGRDLGGGSAPYF